MEDTLWHYLQLGKGGIFKSSHYVNSSQAKYYEVVSGSKLKECLYCEDKINPNDLSLEDAGKKLLPVIPLTKDGEKHDRAHILVWQHLDDKVVDLDGV